MGQIFFGVAGIPSSVKGKGSIEGVREVARLGLDAMEVEFVRGARMGVEKAEKLGDVARRLGIRLSVHAPYFVNICSRKPDVVEKSRKWLLDCARAGFHFGASVIVFHPCIRTAEEVVTEKVQHIVEDNCTDVVEQMKKEGIFVPLGLETSGRHFQFGTIEQIRRVNYQVPGTTIVVDFAHLHAYGGGCLNSPEAFGEVLDSLDGKSVHAHFEGIKYNEHGEKEHMPVEVNEPDFNHLASALLDRDIEVTLICESPLLELDTLRLKKVWNSCRK
jgi:deoxyribonuclease-4